MSKYLCAAVKRLNANQCTYNYVDYADSLTKNAKTVESLGDIIPSVGIWYLRYISAIPVAGGLLICNVFDCRNSENQKYKSACQH